MTVTPKLEKQFSFQRIRKQLKPSASWGPALDVHRGLYIDSLLKSGTTLNELNVVASLSSKGRYKHAHRNESVSNLSVSHSKQAHSTE